MDNEEEEETQDLVTVQKQHLEFVDVEKQFAFQVASNHCVVVMCDGNDGNRNR